VGGRLNHSARNASFCGSVIASIASNLLKPSSSGAIFGRIALNTSSPTQSANPANAFNTPVMQPSHSFNIFNWPMSSGPTANRTTPHIDGFGSPLASVAFTNPSRNPTGTPKMLTVPTSPADPVVESIPPPVPDRNDETARCENVPVNLTVASGQRTPA
jgi:hypothetical protein